MFDLNNVHYKQKRKVVIQNVSAHVRRGDSISLFGPNGAGKSTLMQIMAGLKQPTSGTCEQNEATDRAVGYVPQQLALFDNMTVGEHITFYQKMTKQRDDAYINEMLEVLALSDQWHVKSQALSGGMARKLNLAIGLVHEPHVVLLDEAFVGVDLATKHDMLQWLKRLNDNGTTIVFITHDWHVIYHLATQMWLLDRGQLIDTFSLRDLDQKEAEWASQSDSALTKMFALRH
ncbi:ABC-2 type transport system ATP-binding protein [Alkalibacillus flavidus]|uniref:ABC-2 type transport system ATP-binding protein n=1 Tax=Alkalibacillus flavidus TaxID=546021 RepID=A0ABV2KYB3_9BACI